MMMLRAAIILGFCAALAACSSSNKTYQSSGVPNPTYKVGKPYKVAGKVYRPQADPTYDRVGLASWYGPQFHGRKTANGDIFNMNSLTAAHTTLPMPSYVRVTNLDNNRWLILKINDRGPFVGNRLIDVSRRAAQLLGFEKKGVTRVRVEAVNGPRGDLPRQTMAQNQARQSPHKAVEKTVPVAARKNLSSPSVEVVRLKDGPQSAQTQDAGGKKIYIQVGAYADERNAEKVVGHVNHISPTKIDQVDVNGQNLYRVRIGPHPTVKLAEVILGRILSLGHNTARIIMD